MPSTLSAPAGPAAARVSGGGEPTVDAESVTNAGTSSDTGGGNGPLRNIFRPSLGGGGATGVGGGASFGNGPISKAIKGTIDHIKDALGGGNDAGAADAPAGAPLADNP